LIAGKLCI
ncbi:2,4-dienoyl-CoA reductase, NADH and FMN-linked, partial [Escherichia coli 3006]